MKWIREHERCLSPRISFGDKVEVDLIHRPRKLVLYFHLLVLKYQLPIDLLVLRVTPFTVLCPHIYRYI